MTMRLTHRMLALIAFLLASAGLASAQVTTGTPPFGSFSGGPDTVNNANLNVNWVIPILNKAGRGTNFTYNLAYDSSIWQPVSVSGSQSWHPVSASFGWQAQPSGLPSMYGPMYGTYSVTVYGPYQCWVQTNYPPYGYLSQYTGYWFGGFTFYDQSGTGHSFPTGGWYYDSPGVPQCPASGGSLYPDPVTASDGSGYTLTAYIGPGLAGGTITTANGTGINVSWNQAPPSSSVMIADRNGNQISVSGGNYYDTLSASTPVLALTGYGTPLSPAVFTYTPPNTSTSRCASTNTAGVACYTVNYTNYTVATNFGISVISEYKSGAPVPLPTSIVLPDGSQYTFTYEATPSTPSSSACSPYTGTTCTTGRLASVQLPTGGTISYAYYNNGGNFSACTTGNNGVFSDGSASCLQRETPDGTWTYTRPTGSNPATTTITAPALSYSFDSSDSTTNQTVLTFNGIYETQRKIYQGSATGTLLRTVNTTWSTQTPGTPASQVVILEDGSTQSETDTTYDAYGNLDVMSAYDWGTGSRGSLLETVTNTYVTNPIYTGRGLVDLLSETTISNSNGVQYRQDIHYDENALSICPPGVPQHNDASYPCSFNYRGNATSIITYLTPASGGGPITKGLTYDFFGNVRTAAVNCCQQKSWSYSSTYAYAYPDSVTSGPSSPQLTTSATYNLSMGLVLTTTDPNNVVTTATYDNLGRPLTVQVGAGNPSTTSAYTDTGSWSVNVCTPVQGTSTACQNTILDGLGRPITTQLLDGSGHLYSASSTQYDPLGRAYMASNPYTGSPSYWTQTSFDALGRAKVTKLPDGGLSTAVYSKQKVTTTDPSGKQRMAQADGLGRMLSVFEPDVTNGNALTVQTSYTYDVLNDLTGVTQGAQTRTYGYDALGRLTNTITPEGGTVCFGTMSSGTCNKDGYDSFNNLLKRTDPRGVVTTYSYDTLNRPTSVSYNVSGATGVPATSTVSLAYGPDSSCQSLHGAGCIGRLITMTDGVGSENYTYNTLGQMTQLQKVINGTTYTTLYQYNLAGEVTQATYPSNRVVQQSVDAIGRLCAVATSATSCTSYTGPFATGFSYNTAMQVTGFNYGNGVNASFGYSTDGRQQLASLAYTNGSTLLFGLNYYYKNGSSCSTGATGNNGQIQCISDNWDNGRTAAYTYDALARLSTAGTVGSTNYAQWGLSWTYDRYGNRTAQTATAGSGLPQPNFTVNPATNQITTAGYAYDANGNMTNDGVNTLVYDAENRIVSSSGAPGTGAYVYDGNGLRVKKCLPNCSNPTATTVYIYSGHQVIAAYDNGAAVGSPSREYILAGGTRLAKISAGSTVYYHRDQVSTRVTTDANGNVVSQQGHYPFGESWYQTGSATTDQQFTTYQRDTESGNDYALAREFVSRLGRFSSPDPLAGDPSNPQSLNLYAYATNDPIDLLDPEGEYVCVTGCGGNLAVGFGGWDDFGQLGLLSIAAADSWTATGLNPDYAYALGHDINPNNDDGRVIPEWVTVFYWSWFFRYINVNVGDPRGPGGPGGPSGPGSSGAGNASDFITMHLCIGQGRVIGAGRVTNPPSVGAFPPTTVTANTAAINPLQFYPNMSMVQAKAALAPYLNTISGIVTDPNSKVPSRTFYGVTDVIGGKTDRENLAQRFAGPTIEINGVAEPPGASTLSDVTLTMSILVPCPTGTTELIAY